MKYTGKVWNSFSLVLLTIVAFLVTYNYYSLPALTISRKTDEQLFIAPDLGGFECYLMIVVDGPHSYSGELQIPDVATGAFISELARLNHVHAVLISVTERSTHGDFVKVLAAIDRKNIPFIMPETRPVPNGTRLSPIGSWYDD